MSRVRSRLTSGVSPTRLALETRRSLKPLLISLIGLAIGIASAFYMLEHVGKTVYAATRGVGFIVNDASGVIGGGRDEVKFKGIPAGLINGTTLQRGQAEVTASVYRNFGAVYRDAHVVLRPATPLQDMYIDILDRGTPSSGLATVRNPVPLADTSTSIQAGDVLDTFTPEIRTELATTLANLGGGLRGQGAALRSAFLQLVPFLKQAGQLTDAIAERGTLTRQLVHNTSVLTAELDRRQRQLTGFVANSATTLRALGSSTPSLRATLDELPPTLTALKTSFTSVQSVLPRLNQALDALGPVADELPASLAAARRLGNRALPAVRDLLMPVHKLVPLSQSLRPLAQHLQNAISHLSPQVPAINKITTSVAGCPAALQGFFQWTPSVTKFWTPTGPGVRGDFAYSLDSTTVLKDPNVSASASCVPGAPAGASLGPTLPAESSK